MSKLIVKNARFELINSDLKDYKEVRVTFDCNGTSECYFIYLKENKNANYLKQAEKQFYSELKSGKVAKMLRAGASKPAPWLIATTCVLAAAVIALGSVLIYKYVSESPVLVEYMDNPIKITHYRDDALIGEQTNEYDSKWYVAKQTTKAYATDGSLTNVTTTEYTRDKKDRLIKSIRISTDTATQEVRKLINEIVYESDNKGMESSKGYLNGVLTESSIDSYENTFTDEGEKVVNDGEDLTFDPVTGELKNKNVRHAESMTGPSGRDITSTSTATHYQYPTPSEEKKMYTNALESVRTYDATTKRDSFKSTNITTTYNPDPVITETVVIVGFEQLNEKGSPILTENRRYSDLACEQLTDGQKITTQRDHLNREVASQQYKLYVPEDSINADVWYLSGISNVSYYGNTIKPIYRYNESYQYNDSTHQINRTTSNCMTTEFDQYGRTIKQESIVTDETSTRKTIRKNSSKYEQGKLVPLDPNREE